MDHTFTILILIIIPLLPSLVKSQSLLNNNNIPENITDIKPARVLDTLLQNYAYQAFVSPKTGVSVNGVVPKNLTGIEISALRLRSGSLFTRGVAMYKEFKIPIGVIEQPYVERLVLVYQNLGNRSGLYYPLPGYMYLAPVLGLLAYNGSDLVARDQTELEIRASGEGISIEFGGLVRRAPDGLKPMCVCVDLDGEVSFSDVVSGNRCLAYKQGHFSIVVKSEVIPPNGHESPSVVPPATSEVVKPDKHDGIDSRVWMFVIYVVGGCVMVVLLAMLVLWIREYKRRRKTYKMEQAAETGEPLHITMIGGMKAPAAMVTRTQPVIETEYVP